MSSCSSMHRSPRDMRVEGEMTTPSLDSFMNHPQKRSISKRAASARQVSRFGVRRPRIWATCASRFSGSVADASRRHIPVRAGRPRVPMGNSSPIRCERVGGDASRALTSWGTRVSPEIRSDASERARWAMPSLNLQRVQRTCAAEFAACLRAGASQDLASIQSICTLIQLRGGDLRIAAIALPFASSSTSLSR